MEATLVNPTPAPPQAETAGPLGHMNYDSLENLLASHRSPSQNAASDENSEQNGEQALESHEVIELQAFSERKVWIGEKTKLLEGMPPTEVFADLDAVRASAAAESGLPTRKQLEQWLIEHDKVEKETEIFDSGELKKFKKITKAASKRNLSPQDTDIIELTLTTIQEFDKLLHLLRDRSENLDLLGTRLSWEEQRCAAWTDHRQLMLDLQNFLSQRARWSPSVYDALPQAEGSTPTPALSRRGSIASLASEASSSSHSGFSRSARFRLGEALSREAAQFAGRISSLRHGRIAAAGRALDKLIENARGSVPEELLDEQEKLERQGSDAMEDVGRFIMSVVTQWRKADEFYVETMKDQASAQNLLDDIEAAQLTHPSSRQDSVFSARAGAIVKRLSLRENPCSVISGFPRPTHPLFIDQPSANNYVTKVLGEELEIGLSLAARLERSALDYHAACEAVRRAEHSVTSANELSNSYVPVLHHILNGVESSDGDGTPPDVTTELCLRETKHAAFLALLPSLLQQLDKFDEEAGRILPIAQASLLGLSDINVEPGFKDRLSSAIRRLEDVRAESEHTRAVMTERVNILRDVRRLWVSAGSILKDLGIIRGELDDLMEQQKWKSSTTSHLPPTPESMNASLPLSSRTLENATEQIALLQASFDRDVHTGVSALPGAVGPGLRIYLVKSREGLSAILEHSRQMIRLTESINRQALTMAATRDETHDLQARLEDTESRYDVLAEQILDGSPPDDLEDQRLASDATSIQAACQTFMDSLPHRVVFVSPDSSGTVTSNTSTPGIRRRVSPPLDLTLDALPSPPFEPPIDLTHLDHVVRADCNAFALHLAGGVSSLQQKIAHLDVVQDAHAVDLKLVILKEAITLAEEPLEAIRETVSTVPDTFDSIDQLAHVAGEFGPLFDARRSEISRSLSPIRQLLYRMDTTCRISPASKHLSLSRNQITDDMEAKFQAWSDSAKALLTDIRQREERLRVARREQIEQERLAAEAAELLEKEQAEAEAKRKAEEEREREEAEKAERLCREQAEAEERVCRERAEAAPQEQARKEADVSPSLAFPTANDDITSNEDNSDVFSSPEPSVDLSQVQLHVTELRRRLRSLGINASVKPSSSSSSPLPTVKRHNVMASQLAEVTNDATQLPANISSVTIDAELKSLRDELEDSHQLLPRALILARFGTLVQDCDNAFSDLLEHIDSYPAPPSGPLSASYVSSSLLPPEEQLGGRLTFTKDLINNLEEEFTRVADEPRASSERGRIVQTWAELESMAFDRINGRKSRPPSTISSGRQSRASVGGPRPNSILQKKSSPYSSLSSRPSTRGSVHAPAAAHPSTSTRRLPHNVEPVSNRSSSRLSVVSSNRSVSGPMTSTSRLFNSTFSSRQRTTSLSSTTSSSVSNNNPGRRSMEPSRHQPSQASHLRRTVSPTPSDTSGVSRSFTGATRPTSAWGRPSRLSFPSSNLHKSPPKSKPPPPPPRKPYVANPKSKLDVAVGDVVNKLPEDVDIKVEVAQDRWQDRSGKYWIGAEDPKLCFCRILRSHAVMVRVGGGWMELSKFIQTHFADMVRLLPEPMPCLGSREEKWISSSTLLEAPELITPPRPPRTPEPGSGGTSLLPSFALSTPSGRSPQSIRTHSSPGSPLMALQFLRRVEGEGGLPRPSTPTKSSLLHNHGRPSPLPFAPMRSPNRIPVWKP